MVLCLVLFVKSGKTLHFCYFYFSLLCFLTFVKQGIDKRNITDPPVYIFRLRVVCKRFYMCKKAGTRIDLLCHPLCISDSNWVHFH